MSLSDFTERFNHFLYRQSIRKLTEAEITLAREWTLDFIRRGHPQLNEEQVNRFYENLLYVQVSTVDEWTRRMS
jgi:hypothetical protein